MSYQKENANNQIHKCSIKLAHLQKSSNQNDYSQKQMNQFFKNELEMQLFQRQYDFCFDDNKKPFFQNKNKANIHLIKRQIKLRYRCKNNKCIAFDDNSKNKKKYIQKGLSNDATSQVSKGKYQINENQYKWTTYFGFTSFSFYFEKIQKQTYITSQNLVEDKNYLLRFNIKIYGQKCKFCQHQFGSGMITKTPMYNLIDLYILIIQKTYFQSKNLSKGIQLSRFQRYGIPPFQIKLNKQGVTSHLENLCQACEKGQCFSYYDSNRYKKRKANKIKKQEEEQEYYDEIKKQEESEDDERLLR